MRRTRFSQPELVTLLNGPRWVHCEGLIREFEDAWRSGKVPAIGDFLRVEGPERRALLVELVHVELEFRLKAGESARVEFYLNAYPELATNRRAVVDLLAAEYEFRRRHEGRVDLDEYGQRFPAYRDELCASLSPADPDHAIRETGRPVVPGYEIVGDLGRGGMGVVYKARDTSLGRLVALKFLPAEYAHDASRLTRFLREARTASALNHPHICTVHALGEHEGRPFIVMEFIDGVTFYELGARRPVVFEVARLTGQVAKALAAAHAGGVVHRDIKPENVMVRSDGYVKVLDFGLARRLPTLAIEQGPVTDTDPGTVMGTVAYMSPEQARGEPADRPSDIFSLGIVLYQLLTGQHPFEAGSALGTLYAIAERQPVPPSRLNPEIPAALEAVLLGMLHKDARLRPTAAEVESALASPVEVRPVRIAAPPRPVVRREPELRTLRAALTDAAEGRGMIVCIAGEPGIGKTTLVESFLTELEGSEGTTARGHCSERLAGSEAYLPAVDALSGLLRGEGGAGVARLMKLVAPTWYAQVAPAEAAPLAASQPAMLREFAALIQEMGRRGPVVMFFDDIHWADGSTVDLLAHLALHGASLRLLVVVTYRPADLLLGPHPFYRVKVDLQARGSCVEMALGFLGRTDIDHYLTLAFPGHTFPADFVELIHARTEGNPLFLADLLRGLRERGLIIEQPGGWLLARELPDLRRELPGSVRGVIRRELERLSEPDREMLAVAAVQGREFDSAIVAGVLARDAEEIEERLQVLHRVHGLIRLVRDDEFHDRTLTQRYAFVHLMYQQALYADLPPTRRASLAGAVARVLERHQGEAGPAAELACLYEVGRDFARAARQFHLAGQNAARVFAHREALALAQRGLRLLEALPPSPERDSMELPLQTSLGLQRQVIDGFAAPAAEAPYRRALALCPPDAETTRFSILWGLWLLAKVRSRLAEARELAAELRELAFRLNDPSLALQAQQAQAVTTLCAGIPAATLSHMEQAVALYDPTRHGTHSSRFGQDPGVACKSFGAVALWLLGHPSEARRQSDEALQLSHRLEQPSSLALALHFAAMLHQCRRDGFNARHCAEICKVVSTEHGFSFWQAGAEVMRGWAQAACGDPVTGIALMRQGLADWAATGSVTYRTYYLGLLAEVLLGQGAIAEASGTITEALSLAQHTGEGLYLPELHRLAGEVAWRAGSVEEAERRFTLASEAARNQGAGSLELRAAMSLTRLDCRQKVRLAEVLGRFTEGFETPDLREARALLDEIGT